jgi:hypothetical protein
MKLIVPRGFREPRKFAKFAPLLACAKASVASITFLVCVLQKRLRLRRSRTMWSMTGAVGHLFRSAHRQGCEGETRRDT